MARPNRSRPPRSEFPLSARSPRAFVVVAGLTLALFFVLVVVRPAIERGGWGEVALVFVIFAAVLLFERYVRTR